MVFEIPCNVWRAMQSRLLIQQLLICLSWFLLLQLIALQVVVAHSDAIALPGCSDTCGNVSIPYPFGMGEGCFLDHWFEIDCRRPPSPTSNNASLPTPFLSSFNLEVVQASKVFTDYYNSGYESQRLTVKIPPQNSCSAETHGINFTGTPFSFLSDNVLMVEGCPGSAFLVGQNSSVVVAGCAAVCDRNSAMPPNSCYGVRCCQTPSINFALPSYQIAFNSNQSGSCLVATLIQGDSVSQYAGRLSGSDPPSAVPVFLSWSWISSLPAHSDSPAICSRSTFDNSLSCGCPKNYFGNPYVPNGCQVPQACNGCRGSCDQQVGRAVYSDAYSCFNQIPPVATILGLSISFVGVFSVIGLYGLYRFIKRRREMKRRAKFFKRNGGLLLQQQLSSDEGIMEKTKNFSIGELDKATDHFNENRILGQGGQGTVYKGMLLDGKIVAIKKSKLLDESLLEQFINEVVILSQINHRNVVKLLGCCLETEVPLLVYEFIPNGTLSQHIHDPDEDFEISWERRLKIAADSAAAIAYLHSSASIPIYHRDIKSSNILLDEKHRARVSDFGSSKTIAIDQTHMTTLVQGTMGYLDPEYFQSYQFTEKSDVYSFGVVLLEILTGMNPIYRDASTMEQKNLVTEFLFLVENSGLSKILDPKIVKQAKEEELMAVVDLAKCCISWSGKLRPTMKEVAMTLEMIMKSPDQASTCYQQAFPAPDDVFAENVITGEECMSGLGNSLGMLLFLACIYKLYRFIKRRMEMKRRAKFFKRNGGLLLQQKVSSNEGIVERTKIFTISELNKATNNFNTNRILGQGGQGTVYKGMLKDGSIVAVKKSKLVDESQLEQFINEVVILSRISHRHVVKLFGCCLETEVPLLVYEFIPNGTLYEHIHDPDEDFFICWEMRLKIAADSAGAIAYLHSSSSVPIYHRDIKSSNILLDEKHRGKVSDFGSSKTIAIDQTHLTTLVQGTMGYLDPEYFQSYQFTEKSDVYSFGVVLLELLTSKKPIMRDASTAEQKNLVTEFQFLSQNSRLSEILDPEIVKQAKEDELISVVELAKRCVSWSGNLRPTMKEVAMTMERIMKSPAQVSAWYQQQEDIPIQYAAYDEFDMTGVLGEEFMWSTGPADPSYTDPTERDSKTGS